MGTPVVRAVVYLMVSSLGILGWGTAWAQGGLKADAIALAARHPALEALLTSHPGWSADAYDTRTAYGIWRVQFFFPGGAELGWADVSPKRGKVLAWEADYQLSGEQYAHAERALFRFVRNSPEVRALVGDPDKITKYFWYDSWREGWFVRLERGPDTLDVSIRSRFKGPLKLSNLFIEKIYLSNALSYTDYQEANRSGAVALAFGQPEIAEALRDALGWTSTAEPDGRAWRVRFSVGERVVATALVDLGAGRVQHYDVAP